MSTKLLLHFYQQPGKTSHQWKYIVSDISDHFSQVCITSYKKTLCKSARLYSSFSAENFNKVLAEVDWDRMVANGNDNVNNLFSSFYNNFNKIVNKHAPIKKLSNRKENNYLSHGLLVESGHQSQLKINCMLQVMTESIDFIETKFAT
jgi:hypothetical protein